MIILLADVIRPLEAGRARTHVGVVVRSLVVYGRPVFAVGLGCTRWFSMWPPGACRGFPARDPSSFRGHGDQVSAYLACFPPTVREVASPSLHRVPRDGSPGFDGTMRRCDSLPPISPHFVSFAWRYHRCVLFVPPGPGRGAVDQSGVGRRYLRAALLDGTGRVSQVPGGTLVIIRHTPPTPV